MSRFWIVLMSFVETVFGWVWAKNFWDLIEFGGRGCWLEFRF